MYYSVRMRFPAGKKKALTFSYDDDTVHNVRLVEIFNRYGMKGTFNLNMGRFALPGEPSDSLTLDRAKELFLGSDHEVAVHGYTHIPLGTVPKNVAVGDVILDLAAAERAFGRIVRGMAYADGSYRAHTDGVLAQCGVAYCRTVQNTHAFALPENWLYLHPTCHHDDGALLDLADRFLSRDSAAEGGMFFLWGHAYEFANNRNWDRMEAFCEKMAGRDEIWYATNLEICDYVRDFHRLIFSLDGTRIHNPTATEIFFAVGGETDPYEYSVKPGETVFVDRTLPTVKT